MSGGEYGAARMVKHRKCATQRIHLVVFRSSREGRDLIKKRTVP
jgi:hypothetical protein